MPWNPALLVLGKAFSPAPPSKRTASLQEALRMGLEGPPNAKATPVGVASREPGLRSGGYRRNVTTRVKRP